MKQKLPLLYGITVWDLQPLLSCCWGYSLGLFPFILALLKLAFQSETGHSLVAWEWSTSGCWFGLNYVHFVSPNPQKRWTQNHQLAGLTDLTIVHHPLLHLHVSRHFGQVVIQKPDTIYQIKPHLYNIYIVSNPIPISQGPTRSFPMKSSNIWFYFRWN